MENIVDSDELRVDSFPFPSLLVRSMEMPYDEGGVVESAANEETGELFFDEDERAGEDEAGDGEDGAVTHTRRQNWPSDGGGTTL